ncbi:MAG: alpha/beta fold hydrolase [Phycisphaerales bacterium]|nr:alpha/beta fold hydrolase [Phycisphaerales bacterium]
MAISVVLLVVIVMARTGGFAERFFFMGGPSPGDPPTGVTDVYFYDDAGRQLHGWWTAANVAPGESLGTVIHVHGNAMSVDNHHPITSFLAQDGFDVFIFDYRGFGKSEGKIRTRNDGFADLRAAIEYVKLREGVDPDRIAIFGHSIGGALALCVAAERNDLRAVISVSSFASWRGVAANTIGGDNPGLFARALSGALIRTGVEPIDMIREINTCPVLLFHGILDEITPYSHAQALLSAGQDAGIDIRLRTIEGGDHNNLPLDEPPLSDEIAAFLAESMRRTVPSHESSAI